jgi:hypothetical protein
MIRNIFLDPLDREVAFLAERIDDNMKPGGGSRNVQLQSARLQPGTAPSRDSSGQPDLA